MLAQLQKLVSQLHISTDEAEMTKGEETNISPNSEPNFSEQKTTNNNTNIVTAQVKSDTPQQLKPLELSAEIKINNPLKLDEKPTGETMPLVEKVMLIMKDRITAFNLAPGTRLPSIRRLAVTMEVSKSTIVDAYDRLEQQGIIQARRGSGFFVSSRSQFKLVIETKSQNNDIRFNKFKHIAKLLNPPASMIAAGAGLLPIDWLPQQQLETSLRDVVQDNSNCFGLYDDPQGFAPLRSSLSKRLKNPAINITPDNLLLTDSATQALDLVCRYYLQAGDTVLIDDPCPFIFLNILQAHRVKAIAIPFTTHGPDLDYFANAAATHRPRLYITNSGFQNPTGASITPVHAHRLLTIAEQHNIIIIEDHSYAELSPSEIPSLTELDGLNRTIRISGFSKALSPSLRAGYIATKDATIQDLTNLKLSTILSTNKLTLQVVDSIIRSDAYAQNIAAIQAKLKKASEQARSALKKTGLIIHNEQNADLFIWAQLPNNMDASALSLSALDENIILAPGELFSQNDVYRSYLRFNATQSNNKQLTSYLTQIINQKSS